MQYIFYFLLIAAGFGLVALFDFLLKKLFRTNDTGPAGLTVRMPRYSFILGMLLTLLAIVALLYLPPQQEHFLWLGCWVVLAIGLYLLVNFFWTGISYDEDGFTYRTFPKKAKRYRYSDITGQRTFVAKNGWNAALYVKGDEIQLYAAMQGLPDFMNNAFFAWCRQKGIDPDTVRNDPHMLIFFPDPED